MSRSRATAATDDIQPPLIDKTGQLGSKRIGRFGIITILIRQTGIGIYRNMTTGQLRQRAEMIGHELRPGGAVQADTDKSETIFQMCQTGVERFNPLPRQHGSGRLNRA